MALTALCPQCPPAGRDGLQFCSLCGEVLSAVFGTRPSSAALVKARKVPRAEPEAAAAPTPPVAPPPPPESAPTGYAPPPVRHATTLSIVTETLRIWTKDLLAYLGIFALYGVGAIAITLLTTWAVLGVAYPTTNAFAPLGYTPAFGLPASYAYVLLVTPVLMALLGVVFTATVTYYALCKRRGARVPWSEALRTGAARFRSVLVGGVLLAFLATAFAAVDDLPYVESTPGQLGLSFFAAECGLLVLLVPVVFLLVALGLYAPAVMMEGVGAVASLRRSWAVTRGHRLSIFGAGLLFGFLVLAANFAAAYSMTALGNLIVATAAQLVATAVTGSWSTLMPAVAYELIGGTDGGRPAD